MKLEVIKKFNGKAEGKVLQPGDVVVTTDIDRINDLVKGGYCKITSLEEAAPAGDAGKVVEFQGEEFGLDEVKAALGTILLYIIPHTLPFTDDLYQIKPFPVVVRVEADRKVVVNQAFEINQWSGDNIALKRVGAED